MLYENYQLLVFGWLALGLSTFFFLLKKDAPFGRHVSPGWGPTVGNRFGWVVMEATVLFVFFASWWLGGHRSGPEIGLMLALFVAHYLHRSLIFPFFLHTRGKRMPLVIVLSAMFFNCVNGFLLGYWFGHFAEYPGGWFTDWRFLLGLTLFLGGAWVNIRSDYRLIALRKPGETGYKIPDGGWFRYLSCPNHFGEMVEWSGYALLTWSLPGLAFALWTLANLVPRALAHHRWYRENFADYPAERRAFFPAIRLRF